MDSEFVRSLCVFVALLFGGFCVSLRGWLNSDDELRRLSVAWIGFGWLISSIGVAFWFATLSGWRL